MFVLELEDFPGYYHHKNSGANTNEQWEGIYQSFDGYAREFTNIIANAKVHTTREKAEKATKKVKDNCSGASAFRGPININIIEIFMVSERELNENPILKKAFDDFRLAQKLSAR